MEEKIDLIALILCIIMTVVCSVFGYYCFIHDEIFNTIITFVSGCAFLLNGSIIWVRLNDR